MFCFVLFYFILFVFVPLSNLFLSLRSRDPSPVLVPTFSFIHVHFRTRDCDRSHVCVCSGDRPRDHSRDCAHVCDRHSYCRARTWLHSS